MTSNTPFIGVASQSKSKSILAYYGIENHSKWIYTPLFRGAGTSAVNPRTRQENRFPQPVQQNEER